MSIREAQRVLVARFIEQTAGAMSSLGWMVEPGPPADPGSMFLGTFRRAIAEHFAATVEFTLESSLTGGFIGMRRLERPRLTIGGEIGVRHIPTEQLIRQLKLSSEVDITLDLADVFAETGQQLPVVRDDVSADRASATLVAAAAPHAVAFAHAHSNVEAMLSFILAGAANRDEMFECEFVPALLAGSGRLHEARQAVARYRQRPKRDADEKAMYDRFTDQLLHWLDDQESVI
ncbi:MAG: hypothetical protein QOF83_2253 [Solirubrobacteraceae bacterium]|nr:hypothetical protein [Solirubrobacteraceae bacterium]